MASGGWKNGVETGSSKRKPGPIRTLETGGQPSRFFVSDCGGANNRLLNQMTADATGRTVLAGPAEATAIGNLLVQAMGVGMVDDLAHLRAIVRASFETERFEPAPTLAWEDAQQRFDELSGAAS